MSGTVVPISLLQSGMWDARGRRNYRRGVGFSFRRRVEWTGDYSYPLMIRMEGVTKGRTKLGKGSPLGAREV